MIGLFYSHRKMKSYFFVAYRKPKKLLSSAWVSKFRTHLHAFCWGSFVAAVASRLRSEFHLLNKDASFQFSFFWPFSSWSSSEEPRSTKLVCIHSCKPSRQLQSPEIRVTFFRECCIQEYHQCVIGTQSLHMDEYGRFTWVCAQTDWAKNNNWGKRQGAEQREVPVFSHKDTSKCSMWCWNQQEWETWVAHTHSPHVSFSIPEKRMEGYPCLSCLGLWPVCCVGSPFLHSDDTIPFWNSFLFPHCDLKMAAPWAFTLCTCHQVLLRDRKLSGHSVVFISNELKLPKNFLKDLIDHVLARLAPGYNSSPCQHELFGDMEHSQTGQRTKLSPRCLLFVVQAIGTRHQKHSWPFVKFATNVFWEIINAWSENVGLKTIKIYFKPSKQRRFCFRTNLGKHFVLTRKTLCFPSKFQFQAILPFRTSGHRVTQHDCAKWQTGLGARQLKN